MFDFKKAVRENVYAKVCLIGSSGSGKSYSALRLATGMGQFPIALVDTEGGRGKYYADKFDYLYLELQAPFNPERYIDVIESAEKAGIKTLIIDSGSHEWSGRGGCLEIQNNMPGNSYTNWAKVTPRHNKFIEAVLNAKMNILMTLRGKDTYVLETNSKGKQAPKKVGMGAVQRDGVEYEYTISFNVDQENHIASASKDNTGMFDGQYILLTEEHGKMIIDWCNGGNSVIKSTKSEPIFAEPKVDENSPITLTCLTALEDSIKETQTKTSKILSYFGVESLNKLTMKQYKEICDIMEGKK